MKTKKMKNFQDEWVERRTSMDKNELLALIVFFVIVMIMMAQ